MLENSEAKTKLFENIMLIILGIMSVLAVAIICLLPDAAALITTDKIKEIVIIALVCMMAFLSNTLNAVAIVLYKERR